MACGSRRERRAAGLHLFYLLLVLIIVIIIIVIITIPPCLLFEPRRPVGVCGHLQEADGKRSGYVLFLGIKPRD